MRASDTFSTSRHGKGICFLPPVLCLATILLAGFAVTSAAQDPPAKEAAGETAKEAAEKVAFTAAAKAFQDGFHRRAESALAEFVQAFPDSPKLNEALLLRAQSLFKLEEYDRVIELLTVSLPRAGSLKDGFRYWLGHAHYRKREFAKAEVEFAELLRQSPDSDLALEAVYWQAKALSRSGEFQKVVALLSNPGGVFEEEAKKPRPNELISEGLLLLGESLFATRQYQDWIPIRDRLSKRKLSPELNWQWEHLNCRNHLAGKEYDRARQSAANLVRLAETAGDLRLLAESISLHAEALERLDRFSEAIEVLRRNLEQDMPADRRRKALEEIIALELTQNKNLESIKRLESIAQDFPEHPVIDLARLTIGELYMELHALGGGSLTHASPDLLSVETNVLARARAQFDGLIEGSTNELRKAEARLRRGECFEIVGRISDSLPDFQAAADALPVSESGAYARFKVGDAFFKLARFPSAVTNYLRVIDEYPELPRVKGELARQALYQVVQAEVAQGRIAEAQSTFLRLKRMAPASDFVDRSLLLLSQAINREGRPREARELILATVKDRRDEGKETALEPDLSLALGRTYITEREWGAAIDIHEQWLQKHEEHALRPRTELDLAWLYDRSGSETNAFRAYTDFVARFPTDRLAILARDWIANHHFRHGRIVEAELQYQMIFQSTNWPPSELTYRAELMAGRMAVARQGWQEARGYFTHLINLPGTPAHIRVDAYFSLGDMTLLEPSSNGGRERFENAITIFNSIPQKFPENPKVPLAWGKIANCHWSLATEFKDPERLKLAGEFYARVVDAPQAGVAVRSQAKVGLGNVAAAGARLKDPPELKQLEEALAHYQDVIYNANFLREGEHADPFWLHEAGVAAGRLLEELGRKDEAVRQYRRLQKLLPNAYTFWQRRIDQLDVPDGARAGS